VSEAATPFVLRGDAEHRVRYGIVWSGAKVLIGIVVRIWAISWWLE